MNVTFTKTCEQCGDVIPPERFRNQPAYKVMFCSQECGQLNIRQRVDVINEREPNAIRLNQGTSGAVSELIACVDLMRRGYHVFRAQSPACPCDLVIMKGAHVQRVEVRTGNVNLNGTINYAKHRLEYHEYDILAVVIRGKDIMYIPDLD